MFEEIINLYREAQKITFEINKNILAEHFDQVDGLLDKRGIFLDQINVDRENTELSEAQNLEIQAIIEEIKVVESDNLERLEKRHKEIGDKLINLSKNNKVLSSYKIKKPSEPEMYDEAG